MSGQTGRLIVAAVISAAVGFGSFHAWRRLGSPAPMATAIPVAQSTGIDQPVSGGTDTLAADSSPPAVIPDQIPDIRLPDLKGRQHALTSYKGRMTIFNFWASWCAPCRREIPLLNELARTSRDLQLVGIAADLESNVVEFIKTNKIDYEVLVGERQGTEAAARFGLPLALPFSVFVSAQGHVVTVKLGELHREEAAAILAAIRALDQGQGNLPDTQQQIAARMRELAAERARQPESGAK